MGVRQSKAARIETDILRGVFGLAGPLPPLKILTSRYGICSRTARKVLGKLAGEGVIDSRGRRYFLAGATNLLQSRRIVFVTVQEHLSQVSALNQKHNQIAGLLESKCIELGMSLTVVEVDFWDAAATDIAIAQFRDHDRALGFVFDAWWYRHENFRQNCLKMLDRVVRFNKPTAILDELGCFDLPVQHGVNPLNQVFRIEGARAGERMARLLHSLGHREIAFLSPLHYADWSQERFSGVRSFWSRLGLAKQVSLFAENLEVHIPYTLTVSGLRSTSIQTLISVGLSPSQVVDIVSQWKTFVRTVPKPYAGYPRLKRLITNNLAELAGLAERPCDPLFKQKAVSGALEAAGDNIYNTMVTPLFLRASRSSKTTAWICATDDLAFRAISFLKQRGVAVPGKLSVCGFDNYPVQALANRLTTFDFNAAGFISQMLNFIMRPPRPRGRWRHEIVEVEGFIVERETTGAAGKTELPPRLVESSTIRIDD